MSILRKIFGLPDPEPPVPLIKPSILYRRFGGWTRMYTVKGNSERLNRLADEYCDRFNHRQSLAEFQRYKQRMGRLNEDAPR